MCLLLERERESSLAYLVVDFEKIRNRGQGKDTSFKQQLSVNLKVRRQRWELGKESEKNKEG